LFDEVRFFPNETDVEHSQKLGKGKKECKSGGSRLRNEGWSI
jgi:hypothetical protein